MLPDNGRVAHGDAELVDPHLQRARRAIEAATRGLSTEAWQRAAAGQWNSAQILEHLGKAYGSTAYILDKCVSDGAPKGRRPSWRQWLFTTLIIDVGYFPTGVQAPAITRPEGLSGAEALTYALQSLEALDTAAARCDARFGRRARVANHPILGGFTVHQWRRFHWSHTRHHMRQIAQRRG
jgi:hypothetical protein